MRLLSWISDASMLVIEGFGASNFRSFAELRSLGDFIALSTSMPKRSVPIAAL